MNESTLDQNQAPIPFRSHTALLLSTALPFIQPSFRHPLELALKFLEFSETLRFFQEFHTGEFPFGSIFPKAEASKESGIFGIINSFVLDIEGLLLNLSKVSTGDGKEVISLFLNLIRAKKFYEDYGDIFNSFLTPGGDGLNGLFGDGAGNKFSPTDLLSTLSLLNPGAAFPNFGAGNAAGENSESGNAGVGNAIGGNSESGNVAAENSHDTNTSEANTPDKNAPGSTTSSSSTPGSTTPDTSYMQSLTSMLNDDQRETLDLLKTLFSTDTE